MANLRFKDLERYTTTYIACTNWSLNHISFFWSVPIVSLTDAVPGDIVQVKYKDPVTKKIFTRGEGGRKDRCFSNCASTRMYIGEKTAVLKVPSCGKVQITGCKTEDQAVFVMHRLWEILKRTERPTPNDMGHPIRFENHLTTLPVRKDLVTVFGYHDPLQAVEAVRTALALPERVIAIPVGEVPKIVFHTVMNNISWSVDFNINKRKLHHHIYRHTNFHVIQNDEKYAGITIKFNTTGIDDLTMRKHRYLQIPGTNEFGWFESWCDWRYYLSLLRAKDRQKEEAKDRYHTFLVFHSGKVIQSGPRYELMKEPFDQFYSELTANRALIEDTSTLRARAS